MSALSASMVVVLKFDGSFRPPRDLRHPRLERRMASCAACIEVDGSPRLMAGKLLPLSIDFSSAHAEYHGLILGLEWMVKNPMKENERLNCPQLLIQGDCKTVIDQLNGRALSRKLRSLHEKALHYIAILENTFEITAVHKKREYNVVCDYLCSHIIELTSDNASIDLKSELDAIQIGKVGTGDGHLLDLMSRHLSEDTLIRISERSNLYHQIARIAEDDKYDKSLIRVGELIAQDSIHFSNPKQSLSFGIQCQVKGLERSMQCKKASQLSRKYRVLLEKNPTENALLSVENGIITSNRPGHLEEKVPRFPEMWEGRITQWHQRCDYHNWEEGIPVHISFS